LSCIEGLETVEKSAPEADDKDLTDQPLNVRISRGFTRDVSSDTVRLGWVDGSADISIAPFITGRPMLQRAGDAAVGPLQRWQWKDKWSPTEALGEFLVEVAAGRMDGELERGALGILQAPEGKSVIVTHAGMRRILGW
jgi:hypothetical protein